MQATVHRYDPGTDAGEVLADDGVVYPFPAGTLAEAGLRHVRPGQRLTVILDDAGTTVATVNLGSIRSY